VGRWCSANGLRLNLGKTGVINFKCSFEVQLSGQMISSGTENRFLGICIDENLKFVSHINALNRKLSSGCYALRVIARELNREHKQKCIFWASEVASPVWHRFLG